MDPFVIKQGDTLPFISAILNDDGTPIVIPEGATARFVMRARSRCGASGAQKVDAAAMIDDGAAGEVHYEWAAGDTDTPGLYDAEFKIDDDGAISTYPSNGYIPVVVVRSL